MNNFIAHYRYDTNIELIEKLCEKFNLRLPSIRANKYGDVDVSFIVGLNTYLVEINREYISLKKEVSFRKAQKHSKNYFSEIERFKDGNIWYNILKFISIDSKI